jgi:ArsR family transcriptional regulator, virulence genes transcriptional regulator
MPDRDAATHERYGLHAELCKVLTDPKRLMLLDALRGSEQTVGDLAAMLGVTLANASQHLAVLRNAGLVDTRRIGTSVVYRLAEPAIVEACTIVDGIIGRRLGQPPVLPLPFVARSTITTPTGDLGPGRRVSVSRSPSNASPSPRSSIARS